MKTLKRRRKEKKTDYAKRLKLLKGNSPRIVFRKTNKYIIAQYVTSKEAQDKIEFGITSKKLLKYEWPDELQGSLKSIPASYLTGILFGKKIIEKKLKAPIFDFGMHRNIHKGRIYGFLKGLIDAGIKMKVSGKKDVFPSEETIKGKFLKNKKISEMFNEIKSRIENE